MENLNYLSFPEKELKEIAEASRNNKLVFFIGAGFSKLSETELTKIPSWGELIDELKEDLGHPAENDYLKIAQLYYLKHGQHAYINKVKKSIVDLDPSISHEDLFRLKPKYIITTNWDDLLEKTTKKIGLAYDVISSDEDLAQSQLDKKIIKMHGDFKQHNFVFKEDDYLQYSQNFPLIENYIKGIFSTCTVVFLGYSYSDYNLKQIVSWITNISQSTPKKYLLKPKFDEAQSLYLKNHGVSLLTPHKKINTYTELHDVFFKSLSIAKDPELILNEIMSLVERKIEIIKRDEEISDSEKKSKVERLNDFLVSKIMKTLNEKLSSLLQYTALKPEQISRKFSNCTVNYRDEIALEFHSEYLTNDYSADKRRINKLYIDYVVKERNKDDVFKRVLKKANLSCVILNNEKHQINFGSNNESNFFHDKVIMGKLLFDVNFNSVNLKFSNREFIKLLDEYSLKVNQYLLEKNYIMATIHMANYDYIYRVVKREKLFNLKDIKNDSSELYKLYNYRDKIEDFPISSREEQQDLKELIETLNFNDIYKNYYKLNILAKKNEELVEIRRRGGIASSNEEYTARNRIYPIVLFFIGNEIIIDNYSETKELFESVLLESYEHYLMQGIFITNHMDLFIFIKYFKYKKLKSIMDKLLEDKKIIKVSKVNKDQDIFLKEHLKKVLKNICSLSVSNTNYDVRKSDSEQWLENLLLLLGFFKWNEEDFDFIIHHIISVLEMITKNINLYESIQYFLGSNWHLYKKSYPSSMKLIDVFLNKIIRGEFNGNDAYVIRSSTSNNIFSIPSNTKNKYSNIKLIDQALYCVSDFNFSVKKDFIIHLFLRIRRIGTEEVIKAIDGFINENYDFNKLESPSDYLNTLFLICEGFPTPIDFIDYLDKFIDENIPHMLSNLEFLKSGFEVDLPNYLTFLINEKQMTEFTAILDKFNKKMEEAKK